jgi:hypothetical protein
MLTLDQKAYFVAVCAEHLHRFELEGNTFLVTYDGTWMHYFSPESKRSSMECRHKQSPAPRIIQDIAISWKIMARFPRHSERLFTCASLSRCSTGPVDPT